MEESASTEVQLAVASMNNKDQNTQKEANISGGVRNKNDVDLLCDKKILVNHLGDNNAATLMINNLNEGIVWAAMRDDYIKICKELNSFYEQRARHKWMAVLKRDFFSTPSAAASTIITIVVITVLTFFFFFWMESGGYYLNKN